MAFSLFYSAESIVFSLTSLESHLVILPTPDTHLISNTYSILNTGCRPVSLSLHQQSVAARWLFISKQQQWRQTNVRSSSTFLGMSVLPMLMWPCRQHSQSHFIPIFGMDSVKVLARRDLSALLMKPSIPCFLTVFMDLSRAVLSPQKLICRDCGSYVKGWRSSHYITQPEIISAGTLTCDGASLLVIILV